MPNETESSSFIDQIICQTIALLSERDEFDEGDSGTFRTTATVGWCSPNDECVVDVLRTKEEEAS